jgi:hypothetical protein
MTSSDDKTTVADKVLESIKGGRLKKFSGRHFLFQAGLRIVAVATVSMLLLHLVGFIHFALHRSGVIYVAGFGARGWLAFLGGLPLLLISFSIIFLVLFLLLLKRYPFIYRRPLLYSAVIIVLVVIVVGHLVAKTDFQARLLSAAENLPVVGRLYRHYHAQRLHNLQRGTIIQTNQTGFVMKNERGELLTVIIGPDTHVPEGKQFEKGEEVFVFGERDDAIVRAFGIHEIDR